VSAKQITKGINKELVTPTPDKTASVETFATICKSESDTSFTIPSELSYHLRKIKNSNYRIALYDLGGTFFRIAILEINEGVLTTKSSISDLHFGGDDFDKAIVDWLVQEYAHDNDGFDLKKDFSAIHRLYEEAERATSALLRFDSAEINLPYISLDKGTPKHLVKTLTREKFEQLCDSLFRRSVESCRKALEETNFSISDIDEVILIGNSATIPGVKEIVQNYFGKEPTSIVNTSESDTFSSLKQGLGHESPAKYEPLSREDILVGLSRLSSKKSATTAKKSNAGLTRKPTYSQEQIDALKKKVEPALSRFVRYKKYHKHIWTYELLAAETGIKKADLNNYFRQVEPIGFHAWLDRLRIEEAKESIQFYTDKYLFYLPNKIGFPDGHAFQEAFVRFVGEQYNVWREQKAQKILAGDDPLSPRFNGVLTKVETAFSQWIETKAYHSRGLTHTTVAKALQVSDTELYLYCDWVLKENITTKIIDLRVEEAKKIILEDPSLEIIDVANRVGYSSSSSLSDQFKRRTGLSPSDWKKKMLPDFKRVIVRPAPVAPARVMFDDEDVIKWKRKKGYCQSNISLKSVARECGFSDSRFAQYLRQEENATFNEWISRLRMEEAKRILINQSSLSTEQVGKRLGFSTKSGFITWFKQQTGYTPESWRANVLSRKISKTDADVRSTVSVPYNVKKTVEEWIEGKGYCKSRLSLKVVANELGLTEDQLSTYFYNEGFNQFPVWISSLRIKEAQRLLITYPSMQIITVAARIGMTDVKIFRGIFKRLVGELPTDWREKNSRRPVAEVMTSIEKRPSKPFSLDLEKLKGIESTTTQAQSILSGIFVDDDSEERKEANKKAEDAVLTLISEVLSKEKWLRSEFDKLCAARSIMPGFAIERINDIAFEKVDDILIDDAGDFLYVNTDYKDMLV
jgi:AraC-like DNA-binding protein